MNNCQLFTFQVRKIAARRKYTENKRTSNKKCQTLLPDVQAVHAGKTKNTFDNKSSSH